MPRTKKIDTETAAGADVENVKVLLSTLVEYAKDKLYLGRFDAVYALNQLLARFKMDAPAAAMRPIPDFQTGILDPLVDYAVKAGLTTEDEKLLFETEIMGYVTPAPGEVIAHFDALCSMEGAQKATQYLNELAVGSNYVRMADINKNIRWVATLPEGNLTITINLSKPEKSNAEVAKQKLLPQTGYPKCMLCLENLGFHGSLRHPARETIRIIPMYLNDEPWFMQFSPYVYFDEHVIAISETHHPMQISDETFIRLMDFTEMFPHYFLGSNADLPIVGGSILAHEHYQGGKKVLPMFQRPIRKHFASDNYQSVAIDTLDWYNSVIKLSGKNREEIQAAAHDILAAWRNYSDESVGVLAHTDAPHNTITPIACRENDVYVLYLILRNNRTDEKHPYGIFHPTEDMHNIKKEGIGLIEAMGTFILPGRLQKELCGVAEILTSVNIPDYKALSDPENPLSKHFDMIIQMVSEFGTSLTAKQAREAIIARVNATCQKILECTAVFKKTEQGQQAFERFLNSVSIYEA